MANAKRHPQVVRLNEINARNIGMGSNFGASTKQLGLATGARSIGCSWYLRSGDWVRFLAFEGDSVGYYDGEMSAERKINALSTNDLT